MRESAKAERLPPQKERRAMKLQVTRHAGRALQHPIMLWDAMLPVRSAGSGQTARGAEPYRPY